MTVRTRGRGSDAETPMGRGPVPAVSSQSARPSKCRLDAANVAVFVD
jgi:hypothetical protein